MSKDLLYYHGILFRGPDMKKFLISALVFLSPLGWAQDLDSTKIFQADTIKIEDIRNNALPDFNRIAFKLPLPISLTPASVGVISQKVIVDQNAVILSDALRNMSSINVQNNLGTQEYFLIRGFESNTSGLVLTDGANEPDVSQFRFFGYGFYDLYNIEQVEVLKGPAAFLYGVNTLSGAVNLVRKQPIFTNFIRETYSVGSYNNYRVAVDANHINADSSLAFRFNSFLNDYNQFRQDKYTKIYAVNPVITWKLNNRNWITVNLEYVNSNLVPDMGIPLFNPNRRWSVPEIDRSVSFQGEYDFLDRKVFRFRGDYTSLVSENIQIHNKTFYTYLKGEARFTLPQIPARNAYGAWFADRHTYRFNELQYYVGNQTEISLQLNSIPYIRHFLAGIEINKLYNNSKNALGQINSVFLLNPEVKFGDAIPIEFQMVGTRADNLNYAPYFVVQAELSDAIDIFAGGRYDFISFDSNRLNQPFDYLSKTLISRPASLEQSYQKFSPTLGLVYQDSPNLMFYANGGRAFAQGLHVTDEPEKSTQFEFGYKFSSKNGKYRNTVALYSLVKENITIPLSTPLASNRYASVGSQNVQGLEFEFSARFSDSWYGFLNYSYTSAKLDRFQTLYVTPELTFGLKDVSGNIPAFVPANLLSVWTNKEFDNGVGFGFGVQYAGKQYIHVENEFETPGNFLYNASAFYNFDNIKFNLYWKNIFNQNYLTRGLGSYTVIPVQGSLITGGISINL